MIVASLGQPLLYLLVLGFGLGPVFQKAGNGSYLQFVAPGVIADARVIDSRAMAKISGNSNDIYLPVTTASRKFQMTPLKSPVDELIVPNPSS